MTFDATFDSLHTHQVPDWYHNAKLGIFIHWGLFSVPGWAAHGGDFKLTVESGNWRDWFKHNSYAEWYLNTLKFEDGPTREYHDKTYGNDFAYDDFIPMFNEAIKNWNPDEWVQLFETIGARYVVLTTKHHDGFTLWNTDYPCPHKENYFTERDLVGDLTKAVRKHDMKMGLYYSGGLDWAFNPTRIQDQGDVRGTIVEEAEFVKYSVNHWRELIDKYQPALMWNDIGYPSGADLADLFAYYYNTVEDGVINDRFTQMHNHPDGVRPTPPHYDFVTPEYQTYPDIQDGKWETCRGIGHSFGYNLNEGDEQLIPADKLIQMFVDIVSKNGNLLLNVGPMADGTIPDNQKARLEDLGDWLGVYGDAIFDTRPWTHAETTTSDGQDVRFTHKGDSLYATVLSYPESDTITIKGLTVPSDSQVHILGQAHAPKWKQIGSDLQIDIPQTLPDMPAYSIKMSGIGA